MAMVLMWYLVPCTDKNVLPDPKVSLAADIVTFAIDKGNADIKKIMYYFNEGDFHDFSNKFSFLSA